MSRQQRPVDPYAAPHAPKDKSGPVLRVAIMAVLLAGGVAGWSYFASQSDSQGLTPAAEMESAAIETPQQTADAQGLTAPEAIPEAAPAPVAPAPRAEPRRVAPRAAAPAPTPTPEPVPAPTTTVAPSPVAPAATPIEPAPPPM
jgi:hypothetical protein